MAFENLKPVRLAADADTPAELLAHINTIVMVPVSQAIPTTSGSQLAGFNGYGRTGTDGKDEWVLAGVQDELLRFVNRIPGAGGWVDVEARRVWRRAADDLRAAGASSAELKPMLSNMFAAGQTELVSRGWTAPPT